MPSFWHGFLIRVNVLRVNVHENIVNFSIKMNINMGNFNLQFGLINILVPTYMDSIVWEHSNSYRLYISFLGRSQAGLV